MKTCQSGSFVNPEQEQKESNDFGEVCLDFTAEVSTLGRTGLLTLLSAEVTFKLLLRKGFIMTKPGSPRHAVYAGSFDPITLGHCDIIERGAALFDKLTVAVGINPDKKPLFDSDERMDLISQVLKVLPNVEVKCFTGLTVSFVRDCGASVMLRGIRTLTDIEAEFTMSLANHTLAPDIETVFLMSGEKYTHISSSLIKQIALLGGRENADRLAEFVPEPVIQPLLAKFANR